MAKCVYFGVDDKAKQTKNAYIGIDSKARKIKNMYIGVNGVARQFYEDIQYYTVIFNANGGTGTMSNQKFVYDVAQNLAINSFTRTGYTFIGWSTSANNTVVYNDRASVKNLTNTLNGTVTLYAVWSKSIEVTFYRNLSSSDTNNFTKTYTCGVSGQTFKACAKSGYEFLGWSTSKTATSATYTPTNGVSDSWITNNQSKINLYGVWEEIPEPTEYSITHTEGSNQCGATIYVNGSTVNLNSNKTVTYPAGTKIKIGFSGMAWPPSGYDPFVDIMYNGLCVAGGTPTTSEITYEFILNSNLTTQDATALQPPYFYHSFIMTEVSSTPTVTKEIIDVIVETMPTKTKYKIGETFDTTGLVLKKIYNDCTSENVSSGFTVSNETISAGNTSKTITCGGFNVNIPITVIDLVSLTITSMPTKINYGYEETFNPAGLALKATWQDETIEIITSGYSYTPSGELITEDKYVTVTYKNLSVKVPITVESVTLITFTINDVQYSATENSTWYEWCGKDRYNTLGCTCETNTSNVFASNGYLAINNVAIIGSDIIIDKSVINIISVPNGLLDFNFVINKDETYSITDWKGTKNGVSSTELVVPDSSKIIL